MQLPTASLDCYELSRWPQWDFPEFAVWGPDHCSGWGKRGLAQIRASPYATGLWRRSIHRSSWGRPGCSAIARTASCVRPLRNGRGWDWWRWRRELRRAASFCLFFAGKNSGIVVRHGDALIWRESPRFRNARPVLRNLEYCFPNDNNQYEASIRLFEVSTALRSARFSHKSFVRSTHAFLG